MRRLVLLLAVVAVAVGSAATAGAANDPLRARQWNLDQVGAEAAWRVATGTGVTVAVIDSGVDVNHEDLRGQLVPGHDFVDSDDDPADTNGHGTHVAGIIAAATNNSRGVSGVAPGAKVMPLRVLRDDGTGDVEDVATAIRWAVDHGADIVNLSLGEDTQALLGSSFADALQAAWDKGVIPVVAAGNQFITSSGFSDDPVVVVSATNRTDGKPSYSSRVGGAKWGIAAPGGELPDLGRDGAVLSTYWTGDNPNEYAYLAGTSQAAPHVAGALAILLSTGTFTPQQAVQRLLDTAADIGAPGRDDTFGAGRLDLAAATANLAAPSPTTTTSTTGAPGTASPTTERPRARAAAAATTVPPPPPPSILPTTTEASTTTTTRTPAADYSGQQAIPLRDPTIDPLDDGNDANRAGPAVAAAALAAVAGVVGYRRWRRPAANAGTSST